MDDPTGYLKEPGEPDDSISNGFLNPTDLFNYLSPSAWINDAIASLTGALSQQLGNIIQALADKAILAGISAAAGTALAETGIGTIAGYAAAALLVKQMLDLINKASTIINTATTAILGSFGLGMDLAYRGGGRSDIKLPATAYPAPGA
jgi:hypothetical protein